MILFSSSPAVTTGIAIIGTSTAVGGALSTSCALAIWCAGANIGDAMIVSSVGFIGGASLGTHAVVNKNK